MEIKRRRLAKVLNKARTELIERTQLTDEMKHALLSHIEECPASETKEEAMEFIHNLPVVEKINQLKMIIAEGHQATVEKDFQQGVI